MSVPVTLYQFTLCPFCNKVRAGLDLKGVEYDMVEVSPRESRASELGGSREKCGSPHR